MDRRHFLSMSLTLAAGAALTACGGDSEASTEAPASAPDATSTVATAANSAPASTAADGSAPAAPSSDSAVWAPESLMFTAPLVGGGTFSGPTYAGTPLALWFWSPT